MPPALRIIRKSTFTPKPWKNGGGVTHEAIRRPEQGDRFDWRVSVAELETSGPFSDFSGYHRNMVLLKGDGLELKFPDGATRRLARVGDRAEFKGAPAPDCTLLGGACVDLNLMVAHGIDAVASVRQLGGGERFAVQAMTGQTALIFGIDAAIEVTAGSASEVLAAWDLCLLAGGAAEVTPQSAARVNVFFATLGV